MSTKAKKAQTVREALNEKRRRLRGKVRELTLNTRELFYGVVGRSGKVAYGSGVNDSVYPVSRETAAEEAKFFGVSWQEV